MDTKTGFRLESVDLRNALTDFLLSRQAKGVSPATMNYYLYTAGFFLRWLEGQSVTSPAEVTARHIYAYLAELRGRGLTDWSIHDHARAIKAMLRFWHAEKYMAEAVTFDMPKVVKKRLPYLTAEEVIQVLDACENRRDRLLILLLVDTGLRRAEVAGLNWGDVDLQSGLIHVRRGKGGTARSVIAGITCRRALLAYRRTRIH